MGEERPSPSVRLLVHPRASEVGGLPIRRALPSGRCRAVGPFVFLDRMGPVELEPGRGLDVPPHPHIGLATVTYLFEGELLHRDSVGAVQAIRPGELNWMTAGRGIVHSERTPAALREEGHRLSGLQAWVALPREESECEPAFAHHGEEELPLVEEPGVSLRVVAGRWGEVASPVRVASELIYADVRIAHGARWTVAARVEERALFVVSGAVRTEGLELAEGELAVLEPGAEPVLEADKPARLVLLGGAPLDGPRTVWWNFVAPTRERVEQATADWRARLFPPVPGDDGYVPAPGG